ncbi:MAG: hypothetical protein KGL42_17480, partial [Betaproteobacteria bacterium]|nr:hypothetical protein [Betaproteobacteria bacterium]
VGGSTPFGDINNSAFGEYGKALAAKAASIFQPVAQDLAASRSYRDAIPPVDFLGSDQRAQLGGHPTPAQSLTGDTGTVPAGATPPTSSSPNILQQMTDRLNSFDPQQQADFRNYVTGGAANASPDIPKAYAMGGRIDVGNMTRFGGDQPSSSEGGTNMNIHEPAVLIGLHSGRHYATVAENGYPEQIKITPTPSGKKAAKEAEESGKKLKDVMGKAFGQGGSINADPSLDDMNAQYSQMLSRLGGSGGGTNTPFGGARFLVGAPANAIAADPFLKGVTDAGYSMRGIDPDELWAQVKQFTPGGPQNNAPRVSWA